MRLSSAKFSIATGCLALTLHASALPQSFGHLYTGDLKTTMRISSDLYDTLDAKYQRTFESDPLTIIPLEAPIVMLTESSKQCKVSVSAGYITLINRIAHAKAIDLVEPGYFDRYVMTLAQSSAEQNPPELPNIDNAKYWSDEVMNDQGSLFNQMMGLTVAINMAHHYLGQDHKHSAEMSGNSGTLNNYLTQAEWDNGLKAAAENALECAFSTAGAKALFEAIDKMPHRPAWAGYIVPSTVDLKKLNKKLAKYEAEFFRHSRSFGSQDPFAAGSMMR